MVSLVFDTPLLAAGIFIPAPHDSERAKKLNKTPINVLGGYLRKHGKRLFPTALVVVEAKGKVDSIQRFLGSKVKVIETNGSLCDSRLVDGELQWTQKSNAFANTLKEHTGLIDSIVLATDDDIAGELIGLHAAEIMANIFPSQTQTKRMRFHSVVEEEIKSLWVYSPPLGALFTRRTSVSRMVSLVFDTPLLAAGIFI